MKFIQAPVLFERNARYQVTAAEKSEAYTTTNDFDPAFRDQKLRRWGIFTSWGFVLAHLYNNCKT